ncbi:hypothetical protein [Levilactobacillus wangkuiensis]|nr:hypothetical protein [Levilactobacillus wangkuiensis]
MKKIVMAATLLSIVTGGEVSALAAKTQHSVAKITHVKVTKHKVTGYTTAQSHVKLMKLKHGEKVSATANKHGKFTLKVKSNNLTKLKFKLKATKTGLKARTYTHKVKKAVQSIDDGATTETQTAPASVKPDSSSADKKPEKGKDNKKPNVSHPNYVKVPIRDWSVVKQEVQKAKTDLTTAQNRFDEKTGLDSTKSEDTDKITLIKEVLKAQIDKKGNLTEAETTNILHNSANAEAIRSILTSDNKKLIELYKNLTSAQNHWNEIVSIVTPAPAKPAPAASHPGS